jgi:DNA-binding HxlR family transcriptional regulator
LIRSNLAVRECPLARAMGEIGDGWMLLTLWSAMSGVTRFETMQDKMGVARNILSDRLRRLVDQGLLERKPISPESRRCEYVPTARAQELEQPLALLRAWGDKHCQAPGEIEFPDRSAG